MYHKRMKRALALGTILLLACEPSQQPSQARQPGGEDRTLAPANDWSEPVNGLRGRLLVLFEDLKPGLRHAVVLEFENVSLEPLAITNQPRLEAEVAGADGKPVPVAGFSMSGPIPYAQWGVIPRDSRLRFRVDMQTVGVPTKGQVLLAVGGKPRGLKPGRYVLRSKMICEKTKGPENQWVGQIEFPPVEIVVTEKQVSAR